MESTLKCNALACRIDLEGRALVTSCLHVFCLGCAQGCGLWIQENLTQETQHIGPCPACRATPELVSVVNLKPTDDDKAILLRGLSPAAMIDCVTSALYFWEYQMARETAYHRYMSERLYDRCTESRDELEKVTREKDREIQRLCENLKAMTAERDSVRQKSEKLATMLEEKTKKLTQSQYLYAGLKQRAMLDQLQDAASEAADLGLDRAAITGPAPLASRTLSAFYPKQTEPGYHNAGRRENRSRPSMHPGLCKVSPRRLGVPQFSDQPPRRTQGLAATPMDHTTMNDRSGIGFSAMPAFASSSSQLHNSGQRFDDSRGFTHHAPSGIGAGYGLNNQRPGGQARGSIAVSNLGPRPPVFAP